MKSNFYSGIIKILKKLHTTYPSYNMGKHISTALDNQDIWGISDKEFLYALEKYEAKQELDIPHESDEELSRIINDGMHLESILYDDED